MESPFIYHATLSKPIPVSIILILSSSHEPSWKVLNYIETIFPNSNPSTKYSTHGPILPPPAQRSSEKYISLDGILRNSVNHL